MGEKWPRNFAESDDFHVTFGFFYMPLNTTWNRRFYFPSEGRRAEDFFARKILRLRPGLNPRTRVPKASTLPLDHRSRYGTAVGVIKNKFVTMNGHMSVKKYRNI
jgi:hypothetical protein